MHAFIEGIKQFSIIYTLKWSENVKMVTNEKHIGRFCQRNGRIMFVHRGNAASSTITKGIGFVEPERDLASGSAKSLCLRALPNFEFDRTPPSL